MKTNKPKVHAAAVLVNSLPSISRADELMLESVSRAHFQYFLDYQDKDTGLILDRTRPGGPATIAGVGFALTAYAMASERNWISRREALDYTVRVLNVLARVPQGEAIQGTNGYRGFYYHFLDPKTGERATAPRFWNSELSSIDTALLMMGVRFAVTYWRGRSADEKYVRDTGRALYDRVEWDWLVREVPAGKNELGRDVPAGKVIGHGWSPESGLIKSVYRGYSEALSLYLLALGATKHKVDADLWQGLIGHEIASTHMGQSYIAMPGTPLFCYQYTHCWVDFRGIKDDVNRRLGFDYWQNSVRATKAQHQYACSNPNQFVGYDRHNWGLTACDGPGDAKQQVGDKLVTFRWYSERGAPAGFDDGTIAPTAALSSLPYAPRLVLPTLRYWLKKRPELYSVHGFADAYNDTFANGQVKGWVGQDRLAIDQGPVILMIENYRSGRIWDVIKRDPVMRRALKRANFKGGWLDATAR